MTEELKGVELMTTSSPDGRPGVDFKLPDLHTISDSFRALSLKGRVPIKFGHDSDKPMTDGQPALGWVDSVWVEGNKLLANFTGIPTTVYNAIKAGLYKFVSVELLKDVQAGARKIPWVLDAVALLGADQPAFGSLADLQSLTLARRAYTGTRVCFSRKSLEVDDMNTVAALTKALIVEKFNVAIAGGRCLPRDREMFMRRYGEAATIEDCITWIETAPKPEQFNRMQTHVNAAGVDTSAEPDQQLVCLTRQHIETHAAKFGFTAGYKPLTYIDAARAVMSDPKNRELLQRYFSMHEER